MLADGAAIVAALVPLACWALLVRTRPIGAIVAAVLAACGAFGLALAFEWRTWSGRTGMLIAYVPVTAAVVGAGVLIERRRVAPASGELISWRRAGGWLLLATYVVAVDVVVAPLVILTNVWHDISQWP